MEKARYSRYLLALIVSIVSYKHPPVPKYPWTKGLPNRYYNQSMTPLVQISLSSNQTFLPYIV